MFAGIDRDQRSPRVDRRRGLLRDPHSAPRNNVGACPAPALTASTPARDGWWRRVATGS